MLHLLRLNLIVYAAALIEALALTLILGLPVIDTMRTAALVAAIIQFSSLAIIYSVWRFIPGFKYWVFPNLSGNWTGRLSFKRDGKNSTLKAKLNISQNLHTMSIILETENAESETLVVHPRRLSNNRCELLYVYETRRKQGRPMPFYCYRGVANIRIAETDKTKLVGDYYTETGGIGSVEFVRSAT